MSDQMATAPVEIGTRGTVGSLVMQEIEHFSRLALERNQTYPKSQREMSVMSEMSEVPSVSTAGRGSRARLWFVFMTMKRKRNNGGGGFLPSMCAMVDVVETDRVAGNSRMNYKNLKSDVKKLKG